MPAYTNIILKPLSFLWNFTFTQGDATGGLATNVANVKTPSEAQSFSFTYGTSKSSLQVEAGYAAKLTIGTSATTLDPTALPSMFGTATTCNLSGSSCIGGMICTGTNPITLTQSGGPTITLGHSSGTAVQQFLGLKLSGSTISITTAAGSSTLDLVLAA